MRARAGKRRPVDHDPVGEWRIWQQQVASTAGCQVLTREGFCPFNDINFDETVPTTNPSLTYTNPQIPYHTDIPKFPDCGYEII